MKENPIMKENPNLPSCEAASNPLDFPPNPPQRILMVDDDVDIRRLDAEMLKRVGYELEAAEDGAAAWEA